MTDERETRLSDETAEQVTTLAAGVERDFEALIGAENSSAMTRSDLVTHVARVRRALDAILAEVSHG